MRRVTRLTKASSKRWDDLWSACCLHCAYYLSAGTHKTGRPRDGNGVADLYGILLGLLA
jgi:hypothetical protein